MRPSSTVLALLVLATLVALSLGVSLGGGFVWDDAPLIVDNPRIQELQEIPKILGAGFWETGDSHDRFRAFYRPLVSLSYAADLAIWGLRPFGFHLTNLLLHLACCWLIYRIALEERLPPLAALGGAALFAVHPTHVESAAWIAGRTDIVCGVFVLGSFLAHRRAEARPETRRLRWLSWSLFGLALLAKEMAATLPLLVFADRWYSTRVGRGRTARAWSAAWPYLVVFAGYFLARRLALEGTTPPVFSLGLVDWTATVTFVLARYATLLLMPFGLDAHYPDRPVESLLDPRFLLAALMLAGLAWAATRLHRSHSRGAFWMLWIFAGLAPVLALGRFGDILFADRFLYIPSAGLALLAAHGIAHAARLADAGFARRAVAGAAAVVLAVLATASCARSFVWHDDYALFSDMLRTSPRSALVHNNMGLTLYARGEYARAIDEFWMATQLVQGFALAHNNLAAALEREGRDQEALAQYRVALQAAPDLIEASANLGNLLVRLGQQDKGLRFLRNVVQRSPRSADAAFALASALDFAGRGAEALPVAEKVVALEPRNANGHYLLGKLRYERGERLEAAESMRRFLALVQRADAEHSAAAQRIIAEAR